MRRPNALVHRVTAVHVQSLSRNAARGIGREKYDGVRNLFGRLFPAKRRIARYELIERLARRHFVVDTLPDPTTRNALPHLRPHQSRANAVHMDAVRSEVCGVAPRQVDRRRFRRPIRKVRPRSCASRNRRDVHDFAVPARLHVLDHGVRDPGNTMNVYVVYVIPVVIVRSIASFPAR